MTGLAGLAGGTMTVGELTQVSKIQVSIAKINSPMRRERVTAHGIWRNLTLSSVIFRGVERLCTQAKIAAVPTKIRVIIPTN